MATDQIPSPSHPGAVISLRDLRVSYGEREILHGISFDVLQGETLVILGGSGSGKSTLLRTLVGLEQPSAGEIWIKGRNIATTSEAEMDEIRKKIGMSFQGGALFGVAQADFTFVRYIRASIDSLLLRDIITGLIKSVMFGITITAVGCLEGLRTAGGAEQVGRSTTRAVVMSIFLVVLVDLFFTTLFFFLGGH